MGSCASPPKVNNSVKTIIAYKKDETCSDKNTLETYHELNNNHNNSITTYKKIKEISKSIIQFKIEPDLEEYILPIYLKKDEIIIIHIKGLWSFISEYGLTDFRGHHQMTHNNLQIGQLLFRIQGGPMHPLLNDKSVIQAELDGQLILYSNNDETTITPQGSLDITIEGVCMLRYLQLSAIQDWNKILKPITIPDYLSNDEGELVDLINRVRVNPQKFAKQYIDIQNKLHEVKEAYEFLNNYTAVPVLKLSQLLSFAAKEHGDDIGKFGLTGHMNTLNDITIKQRIEKQTKKSIAYFGENILFSKRRPWSIIVDMLVGFGVKNSNNRINILNESFEKMGLCITKHLSFKWVCVIVFGKDID